MKQGLKYSENPLNNENMKVGIIIQARMSSTRLPGKVLMRLAGKEVLWHVVERCRKSLMAREVIVATSTDSSDDLIYNYCRVNRIEVFRGDLNNVLSRYYECAKNYKLDIVVRVTADCPLIEPLVIDETIKIFKLSGRDYVSNALERIFPRGLDCEVFSFLALEEAALNASDDKDKEHVTPYIINHKSILAYKVKKEYQGNFRLTLDTDKDYKLLSLIYNKFYRPGEIIDVREVIAYLENNPIVAEINSGVRQKSSAEKLIN
ncbi:MAG: glycosyltransferase family protein [bacterium]|nr:glycosyltransferase family protein [bacterium]